MKLRNKNQTAQATPAPFKPKKKLSLKWRIYGGFALFCAITLGLLFLFQVVLLDDFYKLIKTQEIRSAADQIIASAKTEDTDRITDVASEYELCQAVFDLSLPQNAVGSLEELCDQTTHLLGDCVLHKMSTDTLLGFVEKAHQAGGQYLEQFERRTFGFDYLPQKGQAGQSDANGQFAATDENILPQLPQEGQHPQKPDRYDKPVQPSQLPESLIYVKLFETNAGSKALVLNANITPVGATVQTLRWQLLLVSLLLLVLGLLVAVILARFVTKPITKLSQTGRQLAKGDYGVQFSTEGYAEVSQLADTLNFATGELAKTDQLRRELIANVSHDLRTPLTMIGGYAQMMQEIPGENTAENAGVILEEAKRLTSLVNDLLDASKLESGTMPMQMAPYCLTHALKETVARYDAFSKQNGYQITLEADASVWVQADAAKINQVICNLINNAITYTGPDQKVTLTQRVQDGMVYIEVTDTGEGIGKEQLQMIWERYYRGEKNHKRAQVGTGLGLSIVKGVMMAHNAPFGVRSTLGVGSTFWFALPLCEPPEALQS